MKMYLMICHILSLKRVYFLDESKEKAVYKICRCGVYYFESLRNVEVEN